MKNSILTLIVVFTLVSCASKTSFHSFYETNKQESDFRISTPAFFANVFIPKDDVSEYSDLFKKVKHYKIMTFSDKSISLNKKFNKFVKRKNYSTIFKTAKNGNKVQLYFLENKNRIKEILLKIKSDDNFVVLGLKTNIRESDFNLIVENSDIKVSSN